MKAKAFDEFTRLALLAEFNQAAAQRIGYSRDKNEERTS